MSSHLLHSGQPSAKRLQRRVSRLQTFRGTSIVDASDLVIRWGDSEEPDPPGVVVHNPRDAVLRTKSRASMGKFLRKTGVRFAFRDSNRPAQVDRFLREYRVPLFDLVPLACFRSDASPAWINARIQRVQDSFREVSFADEKVTMRVIHLAVRALHALGLDFGLVSIGMAARGVLHVLDVTARPVLEGRMLDLFADALNDCIDLAGAKVSQGGPTATTSGSTGARTLLLGTDLELMLKGPTGKMVLASNYFGRRGRIGCDDRSLQFDGQRLPLMELRPEPDASPLGLVNRLRETMTEAALAINRSKVEWRAGSMPFRPFSTGGHIHFSNVSFSSRLVKALDNYVGLPLMMVEDARTSQLRRPRYGFLGDVRFKNYGGFEYRTPASFVVDPDVTTAAFCLAYLTALYYQELPISDLYDEPTQLAFYRGSTEVLSPIVERNFVYLRRLSGYDRVRDYVEWLYRKIQSGWSWDEDTDVRMTWDLPLAKPVVRARLGERREGRRSARRRGAQAIG